MSLRDSVLFWNAKPWEIISFPFFLFFLIIAIPVAFIVCLIGDICDEQ